MIEQATPSVSPEAVQAQLARIVGSRQFCNAPRLSRFLSYVVEQTLAGQVDRLKGYTVGLEVFDKDPDFDPQTDTIVRVQARALRQKLAQYYAQEGADDAIRVSIAKGGYEPTFSAAPDTTSAAAPITAGHPPAFRPTKPSIAVLPFEAMGQGGPHDFLSLGLTEGVITCLARFKDLAVFSRSTTQQAKQDGLSVTQMHDLFHPDFVLEGSCRVHDDRIETRIKLIDAATDTIEMTDRIDMAMHPSDIYATQDDMAARIAARIAVEHGPIGQFAQRADRSGSTPQWETYAWIARHLQYGPLLDRGTRQSIKAGLEKAAVGDPGSSDVHAALAMIEIEDYRAMTEDGGDRETLERALEHALLSERHDAQNSKAHQALALAYFHRRQFVDFRAHVARALALNPGHSDMLATFGICFAALADWDEAMPLLDRAVALNPLHPDWYHIPKAVFLAMTQSPADAIAEIEKAPMPTFYGFHQMLLWFQVEADNMAAAQLEKERLLNAVPDAEQLIRRHFETWCLSDAITDRMFAAFQKVGLLVAD